MPVRDAKVSASYKNSLTLVTRTNATGAYRVRGFKKDININDIIISCSKDGYKQAPRLPVSRRPRASRSNRSRPSAACRGCRRSDT